MAAVKTKHSPPSSPISSSSPLSTISPSSPTYDGNSHHIFNSEAAQAEENGISHHRPRHASISIRDASSSTSSTYASTTSSPSLLLSLRRWTSAMSPRYRCGVITLLSLVGFSLFFGGALFLVQLPSSHSSTSNSVGASESSVISIISTPSTFSISMNAHDDGRTKKTATNHPSAAATEETPIPLDVKSFCFLDVF